MKDISADHSKEVEIRLKAITVNKQDHCIFFADKSGGASINQHCFSCKWSDFKKNKSTGLCKYKK